MKMEEVSMSSLDNSKLEGLAQDILSDLVEDACLGLCFEVHRAVKQGYFFLDDTDQESMRDFEIVDQPGLDVFGQVYNQWKNKECVCPNCSRSIAASRFAPHLEKCLGMGRNSSRIANRRIVTGNNTNNKSESDQEDNDDVNDNDWSYGAEKKAKKRKSDKNPNSPRRSKSFKHKNRALLQHPGLCAAQDDCDWFKEIQASQSISVQPDLSVEMGQAVQDYPTSHPTQQLPQKKRKTTVNT